MMNIREYYLSLRHLIKADLVFFGRVGFTILVLYFWFVQKTQVSLFDSKLAKCLNTHLSNEMINEQW